jgi:uncharacterized protein (DUF2384 family)
LKSKKRRKNICKAIVTRYSDERGRVRKVAQVMMKSIYVFIIEGNSKKSMIEEKVFLKREPDIMMKL